jgi:diketogulonate reductase-like aldo/keto reductase
MAYSPLGHPNGGGKAVYDIPQVLAIAKAHAVSGAQVGLRWIVQSGWQVTHTLKESGVEQFLFEDMPFFDQ